MKSFVLITVLALSLVGLTGCNKGYSTTNAELEAMKVEIAALKAENEQLKSVVVVPQAEGLKEDVLATGGSTKTFTDLDEELSTTPLIKDLATLGLFDSMGDEFKPYETITRAEYVQWLFKAHNKLVRNPEDKIQLAPTFDPGFTDIDNTHPAFKYVASLASAGYSVGYDDNTFKPEQPITREEMIVIKVGVDAGKNIGSNTSQMKYVWGFSDGDQVDERYTGYIHGDYYVDVPNIQRAFGKVGTLKPKQPVLRHEAAATLWQVGKNANIVGTNSTKALARLQTQSQ